MAGGFLQPLSKVGTGGGLIAKVGTGASAAFPVGAHRVVRTASAGRLFLSSNDGNNFDNTGA
jgi:hypothetical protein